MAKHYLHNRGYKSVIAGKYNTLHGVDLVAYKGNRVVFAEAKGSLDGNLSYSKVKSQITPKYVVSRMKRLEQSKPQKARLIYQKLGITSANQMSNKDVRKRWDTAGIIYRNSDDRLVEHRRGLGGTQAPTQNQLIPASKQLGLGARRLKEKYG